MNAPSVVVGIDGSPAALRAALWAIDEALGRDVPLRLVAVAEPGEPEAEAASAVRAAAAAVDAAERGVRVQTEVVSGAPTLTLLEESRTAAMICIGAVGLRHFGSHRIGSTPAALVASAHCPVAVLRGQHKPAGSVLVVLDGTSSDAIVLQSAVAQARLRSAPLRVLGNAGPGGTRTERRQSQWRRRYPDIDVAPVDGGIHDYLNAHAARTQLVVIGARNTGAVTQLLSAADSEYSVLVVDPQRLL